MSSPERLRAVLLLATVLPLAAAATPAAAQWYGGGYSYNYPPPPAGYGYSAGRPLAPDEITDRLEDLGFDEIGRPRYDGRSYVVDATTRTGGRVRLVVDPVRGTVMNQYALGRLRPRDTDEADTTGFSGPPPFRYGARPSPYDEMPEAAEPRGPARREATLPRREARPFPPEANPSDGPALAAPADPRLAPRPDAESAPAERQASREAPSRPTRPGAVQGLNPARSSAPDRATAAASAARPDAKPATDPAVSPAAPAPRVAPAKPDDAARTEAPRTAAASDAPRKPVRVIGGVTPLNGGQQTTPGPQNGMASGKPAN